MITKQNFNEETISKELLGKIRSKFYHVDSCPITGKRIYFESAGGSLRLKKGVESITKESSLPDNLKRASLAAKHVEEVVSKAEEDVKLFLGFKSGQVMPSFSASHGIFRAVNAVISNIPGDNVVTTNLEHASMYDATRYFADKHDKEWRVAKLSPENGRVSVESVIDKIDKNTTLLGIIHASNITGAIVDLERVVEEARRINPDIYIVVDGVQYVPHLPIEIEKLNVDAYVFGGYKIFAKKGFGFAYLSERISELPHWRILGSDKSNWNLGSVDNANYSSWSEVVEYFIWLGSQFIGNDSKRKKIKNAMKAIHTHTNYLLEKVIHGTKDNRGLKDMDHIELYGIDSDDLSNRINLIAFNIKGSNSRESVLKYEEKNIRLHNRVKNAKSIQTLEGLGVEELVRFSACHYNTLEEINKFLEVTDSFRS